MNTRITVTAALAATALFALAPAQAQAPSIATSQLEAKVQVLQSQVNALQAQVQQLQQQLRASSPSRMTAPAYKMPSLPNMTLPNMTLPNGQMPLVVPQPRSRDNSIPDYTATFISQTAR